MAEKKNGLSVGMIIGSIVVGAAAGVFYHYKQAEIKKLAEDIIARVKPAQDADDESGDWETRPGTDGVNTDEVNIVDSGVSLESVEEAAEETEEAAGEAGEAVEAVEEAAEAAEEAADEDEDDIERPKKPWFWSK